jgi:enoyl-[acyl-carrier protein] reductase III
MTITSRHALITGGSRGIGRGIALKLAEHGVHVAINYLKDEASAKATLEQVRARGADGFVVQADVTQPGQVERMFARVKDEFGALDVFIANARTDAPTFYAPPLSISLEQWDTAMDSQAKAFLVGVRSAVAMMPDGGRIIAITYAPGGRYGGWQPWIAMGSAKAAMESAMRYFAVALAARAITVNAISPGWVEDSVVNTLPAAAQTLIRDRQRDGWTPMRRLGTPADVGNVVTLICSQEAGWITGQTITADGGASLMDPMVPLEFQQPELQPA